MLRMGEEYVWNENLLKLFIVSDLFQWIIYKHNLCIAEIIWEKWITVKITATYRTV